MFKSRNRLLIAGILLIAIGAIAWIPSRRTSSYDVANLIPMLWGWSAIVMSWVASPRRGTIRGCRAVLWIGVALTIGGWLAWDLDKRDPTYKLGLFAFPIVPGCYLAMLAWISLVRIRGEANQRQGGSERATESEL